MAQHQSYISLDSCINDYLAESEQSSHKYFKLWHLGFRGLEDLGLDFFYQIRSVKLPVNANLTVTIPADYLNWTKVGVLNDRSEIIPLYYNDKLTKYADLLSSRLEKTEDNTLGDCNNWGLNTWFNYWTGTGYINYYGLPSGAPYIGSFKIDNNNGVIILNPDFNYPYIMLEYVSSPTQGEDYYLPLAFREAMISWLRWMDVVSIPVKTHMQNSNVSMRERMFYNARRKAIAKWKPIRTSEILQASQEMTRLAVKV